ncbi:MAG: hypothetical protein F4Y31_02815 [Gammaproteobacteria bacterium]|nr:hypothetical protein [Gammaproteobacteria bacterium]MYK36764.1 hypothetical protein [Gammaproteobacteria bacterium]
MVMKLIRKRGATSAQKVPKLLSSVFFWFVLTLVLFVLAVGSEYLGIFLASRPWWDRLYGLSTPFLTGGLVSFFFYFLVVWVPEHRKRKAIKNDFRKFYRDLKEDIAVQIIFASKKGGRKDLRVDGNTEKRLVTVGGFREAFSGGREADEGFYAFSNGLDEGGGEFQEIQWLLRMLAKEIDYVLHNYTITDAKTRKFFKRLEVRLLGLGELKVDDYEDNKLLCRFIYEIFAGFTHVTGNRGYDIVEKMIEDL